MPQLSRLLVRAAMEADFCRRLVERPEEVFQEFDLTEEQKELLRRPDHRLLRVLGEVLAEQSDPEPKERSQDRPQAGEAGGSADGGAYPTSELAQVHTLPDMSLALTVVPCLRVDDAGSRRYSYAVWVSPLAEGADPASLPPPAGVVLPGEPMVPFHVVIQLSAMEIADSFGRPQVGLSASLRQSSNIMGPAPPESAGIPGTSPFASDLHSERVEAAVARVRNATREQRYDRLIDLIGALRGGEVR
jgi:hypothetical protein